MAVDAGAVASIAPTRQAASTTQRGVTIIRVHLETRDGSPVLSGDLTCLASESDEPERAEEEGMRAVSQTIAVRAGTSDYSFTLSGELSHARIRARVPGFPTLERWVYTLRAAGDRWATPDEDVTWDVALVLGAPDDAPHLFGAITVDGVRRAPRGLRIDLFQPPMEIAEARTWHEFYSYRDRRATIWEEDASYHVGPVGPRARAMWVVSDETVPHWVGLDGVECGPSMRLDLALQSGRRFELELVEVDTGRLLPGLPLSVEVSIEQERDSAARQITYRPDRRALVTGPDGRCVLEGLPEHGYLVVATAAAEPEPQVLLQEYLTPRTTSGVKRLEVDLHALQSGSLWGELPSGSSPSACLGPAPDQQASAVRFRRSGEQASGYRTALLDASTGCWSITAAPGIYDIWHEMGGVRVSEIRVAELVPARSTGPLELESRGYADALLVSWEAAPEAELELAVHEPSGAALFRSTGRLESAAGECLLGLPAGEPCQLQALVRREGYSLARCVPLDGRGEPIHLDLCGDEPTSIELRISGLPVLLAELKLVRLGSDRVGDRFLASCRVAAGSTEPLPLAPGLYFYRAEAEELEGIVCGLARVDGARVPRLIIDWEGTPANIELDDSLALPRSLRINSIGGISVADVPETLREFELGDALSTSRLLVNSQGCSWVLR